jgi:RES domain-containing protein
MQVFRIARSRYIRDLTGAGAALYGGRWNHKNIPMIYTAENRSLATVEYLVHLPLPLLPGDLRLAVLEIPDSTAPEQISGKQLPKDWRDYPAPQGLAALGSAWARSRRSLLLRVPSAVVADEFNILISPLHPDIIQVSILRVEGYAFDKRLVKTAMREK